MAEKGLMITMAWLWVVCLVMIKVVRWWRRVKREEATLLLVTAHPDDEAMFFVPTLTNFQAAKTHVLCLSNGNADGLGKTREKELIACCTTVLKIPKENITLVDDADNLQDGLDQVWDPAIIENHVQGKVKDILIKDQHSHLKVVTFDQHGVSSHANHIAVFHGVRECAGKLQGHEKVSFHKLRTNSLMEKYSGPMHICRFLFTNEPIYLNTDFVLVHRAMKAHKSQYVWFRRLFVFFSTYTFLNHIKPISS